MLKILKGVLGVGVLAGGVYMLERGDGSKNKKQETKYEYDQQGNLSSTRSNDVRVESAQSSTSQPIVVAEPVVVEQLIKDGPAVTKPKESQEPQIKTTQNSPTLSEAQKAARTKLICQLFPMNKSKVYGIARINQNTITSIDCKNSATGNLSVSLYEYGDLTEGEAALGRRLATLGEVSTAFQQNLKKQIIVSEDILGRSLVLQDNSGRMVAAGIIAWANV